MKVGDKVKLKNVDSNKLPFLRQFKGKTGKVIDRQEQNSKRAFVRVYWSEFNCYEDLGAWRFELV